MAQSTPSVPQAFVGHLAFCLEKLQMPREGGKGAKGTLGIDWAIRIGRPQAFGSNLAW